MDIDKFLLHLIILLIPGFFGVVISRRYKSIGKSKKILDSWFDIIEIIAYTVLSCLVYDLVVGIINNYSKSDIEFVFFKITSEDQIFSNTQFLFLTIINYVFGIISAYFYNYKLAYKFGRLIKITKHFGEEDVWSLFHSTKDIDYIYLRDHKTGLTYYGFIELFSDSGEKREVVLGDVSVYKTDGGSYLYDVPKVYLSRDEYDITIELPIENNEKKEEENE